MAHPLYHARASAHRYGGAAIDYLDLHEWLDAGKIGLADCRHRLVLHNTWGLGLACRALGEIRPAGKVPVRTLLEEHIVEDLGEVRPLAACLPEHCVPLWLLGQDLAGELDPMTIQAHAVRSARTFGGVPDDYMAVHELLDSAATEVPDWRHRVPTHNAFGPYLAAAVLGRTLQRSDGREVPVRSVAEVHILSDLGRIPTLAECLECVPLARWMCARALTLSRRYGRDTGHRQASPVAGDEAARIVAF
jgi:hypothetical protein